MKQQLHPLERRRALVILLLAVGSGGAGGALAQTGSQNPEAPLLTQKVRVGLLAPLSGAAAAEGEAARRGATLAVEQINAQGGLAVPDQAGRMRLELAVGDTRTTPEEGAAATAKLVTQDRVEVVTGGYSSAVTLAAQPVIAASQTPFLIAGASTYRIPAWLKSSKRSRPLSSETSGESWSASGRRITPPASTFPDITSISSRRTAPAAVTCSNARWGRSRSALMTYRASPSTCPAPGSSRQSSWIPTAAVSSIGSRNSGARRRWRSQAHSPQRPLSTRWSQRAGGKHRRRARAAPAWVQRIVCRRPPLVPDAQVCPLTSP